MIENQPQAQAASPAHSPKVRGSRPALFAGFGALLIPMAVLCVDSLQTLGAFESNNTRIQQDFIYRERTLEEVRASLYESGNILRDYMLDESDPHAQETFQGEIRSLQNETTETLQNCIQSLPVEKRAPFQQLSGRLSEYWSAIDPIVEPATKNKPALRNSVLRDDVLSQHAEILALTEEVSFVNDSDLREENSRIAEVYAQFRRRFVTVATLALTFGLILAAGITFYAKRLEQRVEDKYQESLQAQRQLKELSRRLVDAGEQERRAISRELHDEVGQSLGAMLVDVEHLAQISSGDTAFRQGLQNIKSLAENCVNQVRNMALLLRPSMLDDLGLVAALEWQAREVSKRTGMLVDTVEENVSDNLPEEYRTCVYRVVQEALNNCSKHANAKNVRVVVQQEANHLHVSIEDDGKGFDANRVRGLGLVGMNERVSRLGGTLKVDSAPARGTRLNVDLPLPASPADRDSNA